MSTFAEFLREERMRSGDPMRTEAVTPPSDALSPPDDGSFRSFLRQVKTDTQSRDLLQAQAGAVVNSTQSTATAAAAAPLSRELGLPQAAIETDLPRYQQQAKAQRNASVMASNPVLAAWAAANPDSARVAQDEFDKLGAIEQLWSGTKGMGYSALQGLGGSFNSAALGLNRAIQPWARLVAGDKAGDWWGRVMIEPRAQAAQAFELTKDAGFGYRASQMVGQLLGLLSQVTLTGGTGGAAPAASAGAVETAVQAGQHAARAMAFPSLTEAQNRSAEVYEKTGDVGAAYKAAASTYLFTTLQGLVPFSAPGTLMQRLGTGAVAGAVTSEAQRGLNNVLMPEELRQKFDPQEALFQAVSGAALGGVFGPRVQPNLHAAVRQTYTEALRAEQAINGVEQVQKLGKIAGESQLKSADPQAFKQYIERVSEGSDLEAVYIDPRSLGDALKQSEVALPDVRKQLAEAAITGADVRIPVADFAAHIAGTPLEAALLPKLKAAPDGMTFEEGQQHFKDAQEQLKAVAEQAAKAQTEAVLAKSESDKVYANVLGQLDALQRFPSDVNKAYAALTRDFFDVLAQRTGEKPSALFERYGMRIAAENVNKPGEMRLGPSETKDPRTQALVRTRKRKAVLDSLLECIG